jgi:hypothetical protein
VLLKLTVIVLLTVLTVASDVQVIVDRNPTRSADRNFKFKTLPSPVADDAAAKASLTLIDGRLDQDGADLAALTDGRLPTNDDEPGANVFFSAGSWGGRFRMDLGNVVDITQVNSYSWHPSSRGPQLYKLYGANGSETHLKLDPKRGTDPATLGWTFIATVSTIPQQGEEGGQYAAGVTDPGGSLGKYRYLLFDCYVTEMSDNWGNTFYSEIDVITK